MSLRTHIVIPVAAAVLAVGGLLGVMFWQLEGTREMLSAQLTMALGSGAALLDFPSLAPAADSNDATLLSLRRGDTFALRGEWGEAANEYENAVKAGGGINALRKLAQAQLQRRDIRGAQTTLDQLRRQGARSEDVLLLETLILLRTGEVTKARQLLESAAGSPHKHYGLALLAIISADHATAQQEIQTVIAGWEPVLRAYARTLGAAYEEYALFPESPLLHLQTLLGRALAQVQECELALPLLSQATNSQNDYRDAWIVQGFCELTTERITEALASLEHAYQLDPEKPQIQYFLARAYLAKKDTANALTFLQYALRNGFTPESEVRRLIAKQALEIGNVSLAMEQFDALTKAIDADVEMYQAFVTAAITADRKEEAYVKAQEAVNRWPENAVAHELLGWAATETERKDEAKIELEKAVAIDPKLESAREKLKSL